MSARKVVAVDAAYCVLFGALVQQSYIHRRRAVTRSRPRTRQSFDELQDSLSRAEFTRAFRMSLETYSNLLSLLKLDLTRDMRIWPRALVAVVSTLKLDLRGRWECFPGHRIWT
jgi:hypothetical protein